MKLQSHLGLVLLTHQAMKNSPAAYVEQKTIDRKSQTLVPWSPEEFPNPDLDQRACRTHLNRFCDPDGVLKDDSDVRSVEEHLARVRRFEPKCRHRGTQDDGPFDIQLGVALVDKVS